MRWSAIAVLWSMALTCQGDYQPFSLPQLFGGSELIVLGTIDEVEAETFHVQAARVIAGVTDKARVEVKRFRDWSGNARWTGYRRGQEVLLFLTSTGAGTSADVPSWRIRGLGGEGEMPVEDGYVYCHGIYLDGFDRGTFEVQGGRLTGYRFDLGTFLSALDGYRRCYEWGEDVSIRQTQPARQRCDQDALAAYLEQSPLNRYLVEQSTAR